MGNIPDYGFTGLNYNLYICSHPQTDCFVVSHHFSVARHARFSKLGSKPDWLKRQDSTTQSGGN